MRTNRRPQTNFLALLLGVGSAIACVSGSTDEGGGDDEGTCDPACPAGYVCDNKLCIPATGTGGTNGVTGGTSSGGTPSTLSLIHI